MHKLKPNYIITLPHMREKTTLKFYFIEMMFAVLRAYEAID